MAHLMKFTRGSIGSLTRHYERYKKENGEYLKFGNQEINIEKTYLNYNLAADKNQLKFIKQRTSEVRCLNRKDINVMCSWVVILPVEIKTPEDQEKFFKESYKFLEEKYGKGNVISSFVHLDEVTPHMHFAFIPVVYDEKRKDYKVSAKECITRYDLKKFHPELEEYMEKVFGYDIGILNEKTKEGNKAIDELKKGTARKELEALKIDLEDFKDELGMIYLAEDEIKRMSQLKAKEKLFKRDYVEIKKDTFEQFKNMAKNYKKDTVKLKNNNINLINQNKKLKKEIDRLIDEKDKRTKKFYLQEVKEKAEIKNKITDLEKRVEKLSDFIIDQGLEEKFNKSIDKEIQKNKNMQMDFSR